MNGAAIARAIIRARARAGQTHNQRQPVIIPRNLLPELNRCIIIASTLLEYDNNKMQRQVNELETTYDAQKSNNAPAA